MHIMAGKLYNSQGHNRNQAISRTPNTHCTTPPVMTIDLHNVDQSSVLVGCIEQSMRCNAKGLW